MSATRDVAIISNARTGIACAKRRARNRTYGIRLAGDVLESAVARAGVAYVERP